VCNTHVLHLRHSTNDYKSSIRGECIITMTKKTMTVRDVAKLSSVTSEAVRYYSRIGLVKPIRNSRNGYKLYNSKDISRIIFIRKAKSLGYTLKEIKNILIHATSGKSPCPMVRKIIESRLNENRKRLNTMMGLQTTMERAVQQWKHLSDGIPTSDSVCVLIESFSQETRNK